MKPALEMPEFARIGVVEARRLGINPALATDDKAGRNGLFYIPRLREILRCIVSDGGGWEHVSVSLPNRCPTWEEMCFIKDVFWGPEETVIQYHPPRSEYVNNHPYCLHLWKPSDAKIVTPPRNFVGV